MMRSAFRGISYLHVIVLNTVLKLLRQYQDIHQPEALKA